MMAADLNRKVFVDQRALIINPENQVLLVREHDLDWDLPGGMLIEGLSWRESLEQAIAEKLDLQIMTKQPVFAADFQDPESGEYTYMTIIESQSFGTDFNSEEFSEVKWFSAAELAQLTFAVFEIKEGLAIFFAK